MKIETTNNMVAHHSSFIYLICARVIYLYLQNNQVLVLVLETWVLVLVLILEGLGTCYITVTLYV